MQGFIMNILPSMDTNSEKVKKIGAHILMILAEPLAAHILSNDEILNAVLTKIMQENKGYIVNSNMKTLQILYTQGYALQNNAHLKSNLLNILRPLTQSASNQENQTIGFYFFNTILELLHLCEADSVQDLAVFA